MKKIIYADNAATTKLDIDAFEAMKPYLLNEYGNASQPYSFSRAPKKALKEAREMIASCINAEPEEIYFTSGGTESDNWAIKGTVFSDSNKKDVITSAIEHHAVLRSCEDIEKLGYHVSYLMPDFQGVISSEVLKQAITPNTKLVSIMLSNNEIGTIEPIKELADISHESGVLFHTDAVQSIGHIEVDVKALGVDMLSASAHKFNGPKGIGFLYIKNGVKIFSLLSGGSQEKSQRAGTENIASIIAMAIALKKNCDNIKENQKHIIGLEKDLIYELKKSKINFVRNGSNSTVPGNISVSFPGFEGETILHRLDLMGIEVSTGSACDSINTQISHVLRAIQLEEKTAKGTIRISLSKDNTKEDVLEIAKAIKKIIIV